MADELQNRKETFEAAKRTSLIAHAAQSCINFRSGTGRTMVRDANAGIKKAVSRSGLLLADNKNQMIGPPIKSNINYLSGKTVVEKDKATKNIFVKDRR